MGIRTVWDSQINGRIRGPDGMMSAQQKKKIGVDVVWCIGGLMSHRFSLSEVQT